MPRASRDAAGNRASADLHLFHILGGNAPMAVLVACVTATYAVEIPQYDLLEAGLTIDDEPSAPAGPNFNPVLVDVEELDRVYAAQRDVNLTPRDQLTL